MNIAGRQHIAAFTREGLVVLNSADGKVLFQKHWRSEIDASVNAAVPLVVDDVLLLTAAYRTGAIALQLSGEGDNIAAKELWSSDEVLSSHFGTSVHHDGFIYGFHGRQDIPPPAELRCVELATGKVVVRSIASSRVSYNIPGQQQRFAGERGLRDAEDRAATVIADGIRNRLASYFAAGT